MATRLRALTLDQCLTAVDALDHGPFETIVVDNSPGDPATLSVAKKHGARYENVPQVGLSRARNIGARLATGEIVAFLDDDAVAYPGWLDALLKPFEEPSVVAVTGRIVPLTVGSLAQRWTAAMGWMDLGETAAIFDRNRPDWFEKANFGGVGIGANMAFRRALFDVWGGFRETFGLGAALPGGEENYAFFELIRRGGAVVYAPDAIVAHPHPATIPALRSRSRVLLSQAVAYAMLMFAEEPEFRGRLLRYAAGKIGGDFNSGQAAGNRFPRRILPLPHVAAAVGRAPLLYLRCRRATRASS